jgi:hypothetical protein
MSLLSPKRQSQHQHLLRNRMFHTVTVNQPLRVITVTVVGMATMVKTRTRVKVRTKTKVKGNTTLAQLVRMLDGVMLDKEVG